MTLLEIKHLKKSFSTPEGPGHGVIDIPEFGMDKGESIALEGRSGSGKSTFLNLIAGILRPDSGRICLNGMDMASLSESGRDRLRGRAIGYIFQTFNLLQGYTALENVALAMMFGRGMDLTEASRLLDRVGLTDRQNYLPRQLSVGQQQRVAVARALANRPQLVLADEPTGNLDAIRAREVITLMRDICAENGAALLLVSHDLEVLQRFEKSLSLDQINRSA